MSSVYQINKGVGRSLEFKGLRAQYIGYLAAGLVLLFLLFAVLYLCGVNTWACLVIIGASGGGLYIGVVRMSHRYGQYGLMKKMAKQRMPGYLYFRSRKLFTKLKEDL
ncbi:protein of unknown function [Mucilaginibacter pineti]|uniref:DUF4133 domain-containing protein n=1 Tax=Mucilaginibacter pineti TaxID=1391627 RepID=A0A1G7EQD5_9SPHI|nr:DUF4133 domain-containing protein [Mucilaginibacter pineti]SDE65898.1 protein of unknown function [Mucilaginibacter pineti]